jgi:DNA replication licensing factor MCM4
MVFIHNLCEFTNKQYIKFQEMLENVGQGQTPSSVTLIAYDEMVDRVRPGDCVEVTGLYRCNNVRIERGKEVYRRIFNTYFDVISFEVLEDKTKRIKVNRQFFSEEERWQFIKMASEKDVIDNIVNSFAPSIYGHSQVKKGLLAQLFGGHRKQKLNRGFARAEINVCLVGDPSTAKSQLLQHVHRIAPRSVYTCGRGSTSVGLTANVRKDP